VLFVGNRISIVTVGGCVVGSGGLTKLAEAKPTHCAPTSEKTRAKIAIAAMNVLLFIGIM